MPAWFERLPERLRNLIGKPVAERIRERFDVTDPRVAVRPLEEGDWLCPYCAGSVQAPQWDGSSLTLLEQPEVFEHLLQCPIASADGKPEMKSWDELVQAALRVRMERWPNYAIANADGKWICPHCLKPTSALMRNWDGSPAPRAWYIHDIYAHLSGCPAFAQAPLTPYSDLEVRSASLTDHDLRSALLARVAGEPLFRVTDDRGFWIDPFGERVVESINLFQLPWDVSTQNKIVGYLLSSECPGKHTNWRTGKTAEELARFAGRVSAQRDSGEIGLSAEAEQELNFLRRKVEDLSQTESDLHKVQRDLAAAREVQLRMLPREAPRIPGFEVASMYEPCVELGGDMFAYVDSGAGHWGFLIADVSGHGVEAAMIMSMTMKSLKLRGRNNPSPAATLAAVNADLMQDVHSGKFVTAFYAVLDPMTGELLCARAGHNPALLADPSGGGVRRLEGVGLALGLRKDLRVEEYRVPFPVGAALLLYTDGLVEAQDAYNQQYEQEKLESRLHHCLPMNAQQMVDDLAADIRRHMGNMPAEDDLTMVVLKRVGLSGHGSPREVWIT